MTEDIPEGFRPDDPTAHDRAHTDRTGVTFSIKETGKGEPWIMIEQDAPGLPVLKFGDAFLGLRFRDGVSFADAQRFTAKMRDMIDSMSYTKFIT